MLVQAAVQAMIKCKSLSLKATSKQKKGETLQRLFSIVRGKALLSLLSGFFLFLKDPQEFYRSVSKLNLSEELKS